jgi:hypothetical protein
MRAITTAIIFVCSAFILHVLPFLRFIRIRDEKITSPYHKRADGNASSEEGVERRSKEYEKCGCKGE